MRGPVKLPPAGDCGNPELRFQGAKEREREREEEPKKDCG